MNAAIPVWFGTDLPQLPARNFAAGAIVFVEREDAFATARVHTSEGIREFFVGVNEGFIEPVYEAL